MTRLTGSAGVMLSVTLPLALCGEVDQVALVNQARAKIVANIKKLPKYTCRQTVHRSRFEKIPAVGSHSCSYLDDSAKNLPRLSLAWADRFKLDVTVSAGAEIFSWAGAESFQSEHLEKIVGSGMAGTGDFGAFLMSIFGSGASEYDYLGLEQDKGRTLAVYRYYVPMSASRYEFNVGPRPDDTVALAYEGRFWIDSQNAELSRMTIEVPHPPQESETCRIETTIDYRQARIGDSDFLLHQSATGGRFVPFHSTSHLRESSLSLDLSLGLVVVKTTRHSLRLQADVRNLTDRLDVIDFAGLFSGTAIAPPRSFSVRMQMQF